MCLTENFTMQKTSIYLKPFLSKFSLRRTTFGPVWFGGTSNVWFGPLSVPRLGFVAVIGCLASLGMDTLPSDWFICTESGGDWTHCSASRIGASSFLREEKLVLISSVDVSGVVSRIVDPNLKQFCFSVYLHYIREWFYFLFQKKQHKKGFDYFIEITRRKNCARNKDPTV